MTIDDGERAAMAGVEGGDREIPHPSREPNRCDRNHREHCCGDGDTDEPAFFSVDAPICFGTFGIACARPFGIGCGRLFIGPEGAGWAGRVSGVGLGLKRPHYLTTSIGVAAGWPAISGAYICSTWAGSWV